MTVYGTSPTKNRPTRQQVAELDETILRVCADEGVPMTVRGVFYRVMSAGVVEKSENAYRKVQRRVLELRRGGSLRYEAIADGTRWHIKPTTWGSLDQMLDDAAASYRRALWHDSEVYVEVWSEKDAISSVVSDVTAKWDVPLMIARGFASESFLWSTAQTIKAQRRPVVIYQLGDHDPSGVVAWQATQDRLRAFAPKADITFARLAVTPEQIDTYRLPTRPTKRAGNSHAARFEGESVEVDAIPSRILRAIVEAAITQWIDDDRLEAISVAEASERDLLYRWAGEVR